MELRTVIVCLAGLLGQPAFADVRAVAPGVDLIAGAFIPNTQPDGNSVVFRAPQGLVVVDTGRHVEHTQRILDYAKSAGLPIVAVVNSHWHLDHVSGNPRVRAAYPDMKVFASDAIEDAMSGFLADYRKQLSAALAKSKNEKQLAGWRAEIATIDQGRALYPDVVVTRSGTRRIAGEDFSVHLASPAATAGDVWLFEPNSRVLVAGDLVTLPVPFVDTACPDAWRSVLDELQRVDFSVLVPGHGAPMRRAQFETWRKAYNDFVTCGAGPQDSKACAEGWLADAQPLLADTDAAFVRTIAAYYVDNALRAPKATLTKLCASHTPSPRH
ncbi:MAG: MBL fold metallo-hydrolase [Rudaea sp.]